MTLLAADMRDGQRLLAHVSLSFVEVSEWATNSRAAVCALSTRDSALRFPGKPYMARSVHSAIGCFTTATVLLLERSSYAKTGEKQCGKELTLRFAHHKYQSSLLEAL